MIKFILPLLLCVLPLSAQETPVIKGFQDFSGGINNYNPPHYLAENESPDALNVVVDDPVYSLKQRSGYVACGNTPSGATATALYEYSKSDGSRRLIVTDNSSVWQTADCIAFSTITTGQSANAVPYFKTVRDKLWIVNGSTYPITWDGSTATMLDGVSDRPLAPIGKYIEFWKERVWISRVSTDPSAVYFSDLTDDDGNILDPSTSTAAWSNALNVIYFGRESGSPIYGIKAYRDNLFIFKETGIYRLIFESDLDISITKTVSDIGCKFQDTIVEMDDGLLYFVGLDGIYAFDGLNAKRISDKVQRTFNTLKQPSGRDAFEVWDAASDFLTGTLDINVSTAITDGSVSLMYEDFADGNFNANPVWTSLGLGSPSATNYYLANYHPTTAAHLYIPSSKAYGDWSFDWFQYDSARFLFVSHSTTTSLTQNSGYGLSSSAGVYGITKHYGGVQSYVCSFSVPYPYLEGQNNHVQISRTQEGLFTLTIGTYTCSGTDTTYSSSTYSTFYNIDQAGRERIDNISWIYKSTGVYTSGVSTYSSLADWGTFDISETLDGQSIDYYVRTATSAYNVGLASWNSITSGSIISTVTANKFFQWKAELATADTSKTPLIDAITANYSEGTATVSRLGARSYKNRYWLTGSTTPANDYNDMVMVKTKSPLNSWMLYDLPISAMTLWNGYLYGAISNSGVIARMDYGDNDNGLAIHSHWQTRDELLGSPINYKEVNQIIADYAQGTNTDVVISNSFDNGVSWTNRTLNTTLAPYARGTKILNFDMPQAISFRGKIGNSVLDQNYTIYGLWMKGKLLNYYGK